MARAPLEKERTWFGVARRIGGSIRFEGALDLDLSEYQNLRILVPEGNERVRWLELPVESFNSDTVAPLIPIGGQSAAITTNEQIPEIDLTIAICTRNRENSLKKCLSRFLEYGRNDNEILIIDNAPTNSETDSVVLEMERRGLWIRRVVEPVPGLSRARNMALRSTDSEFIAFTDDDALPERFWARSLHQGFVGMDNVAIVTGLILPAEIETRAQEILERQLKWSDHLESENFSMANKSKYEWPFPYSAGHFGAGANFAVRRQAILDVGGFDEALGAGTRSASGEDNEMFVRVLRAGYELNYRPSAIVWHHHRREQDELRKLLFGYGKGLSATAIREFLEPGKWDMIRGQVRGARNLFRDRQAERSEGLPLHLMAIEMAGVLVGPFAYGIERWRGPKKV